MRKIPDPNQRRTDVRRTHVRGGMLMANLIEHKGVAYFDMELIQEAVDIVVGDNGRRSKEVLEILKMMQRGDY